MKQLSRRSFLEKFSIGVGTTSAAVTLPSFFNVAKASTKPYEGKKLNVALCGLGNYAEALEYGLELSQ